MAIRLINPSTRMAVGVAVIAMIFVFVAMAIMLYFYLKPDPAPAGVHMEAKPAPEVVKVETERVEISTPVRVYKPAAKKKLALPESVQADERKHVIASTKTANDERQHTVTTLIDAGTGESITYDRVDPLPWVAVNTKSELGVYYGLKNGSQAIRLEGKQELFQIKAVHVGATASADSYDGRIDTFVGVGAWARW